MGTLLHHGYNLWELRIRTMIMPPITLPSISSPSSSSPFIFSPKPQSASSPIHLHRIVIAIIVMYLGARVYYRGGWYVPLDSINLDEGRRFYRADIEVAKETGAKGKVKRILAAI